MRRRWGRGERKGEVGRGGRKWRGGRRVYRGSREKSEKDDKKHVPRSHCCQHIFTCWTFP